MIKKIALSYLYLFFFVKSFSQDSLSLNVITNNEINEKINSLEPVFKLEFFKSGKPKKRFKVFAINGDQKIGKSKKNKVLLNLKNIKATDSIFFVVKYKNRKIVTEKYAGKRLVHGGKLTIGIAFDYHREKEKYLRDTTLYYNNNVKSYLYGFMNRIIKDEGLYAEGEYELHYSVLSLTTTIFSDYRYEMKKKIKNN